MTIQTKNTKLKLIDAVQDVAEQSLNQSMLLSLVGYNCRRAFINIMPLFEKRMARYQLRPVDFSILSLLKANPNINQKRLSDAVNVSPPNLAILLDKLQERGLLLRQRNPLDRRSQTLVLTATGMNMCIRAEKTVSELEIEATAALTNTERAQLIKLLQKIYLE
ncbi:MarR family winged helix-turn-helix transcriptional regulator [Undibacterium sp. RuTC16W]|uniref:MarR family winged helix-turn-helix transcriptional regulator n=1 Tax=Undibacterium sp. RuTC16W TaxID=3413048 RepID=UPI003BF06E12